ARRPCQPIQPGHDQRVALGQPANGLAQRGPIRLGPGRCLCIDLCAACEPQRAALTARADWVTKARPAQRTPIGDWGTWLILAGRGWGKTRTGAEDVAFYAMANDIAVIAPTYSDERDT